MHWDTASLLLDRKNVFAKLRSHHVVFFPMRTPKCGKLPLTHFLILEFDSFGSCMFSTFRRFCFSCTSLIPICGNIILPMLFAF